ncbi:MAG: hypothetical protein RLN90_10375 [Balneolaceae bacterium]
MKKYREIDEIRESGGSANIGTDEDGAIMESLNLNDERFFIIKERAIYEVQMADDIDPDRTNIHLPNMIQKLSINQGTESELVCRTFLTAKRLFKKGSLLDRIDTARLLHLSLELLQELIALDNEVSDYMDKEKEVSEKYHSNTKSSFSIPSISDVVTRCKTIFQKSDHIEQIMMEMIVQFYPNKGLTKQSHYPKFHEVLNNEYGEKDQFTYFIKNALYFMQVVRLLRNGLDHRLNTVTVSDFELRPDSSIISPTIQLDHKDVKMERESLSSFLPTLLENFKTLFENLIAYLSNKHIKPNPMNFSVKVIPEERRRNKYIRFALYSPLGKDGYFDQV